MRLTGVYPNRSILGWMNALNSRELALAYDTQNSLSGRDVEKIIWALANGISPFMIFGIYYRSGIIIAGGRYELAAILDFINCRTSIDGSLLSLEGMVSYGQLSIRTQQNILSVIPPAVYCEAQTSRECEALLSITAPDRLR